MSVADFVYMTDKFGKPYGWGVAQYTTPEVLFGYEWATSAYKKTPEASERSILEHLSQVLPEALEKEILRIVKG